MILVDSSVWIAYFNGVDIWQAEILDQLLQTEPVIIGDLILTEVLQGFRYDKDFNLAKETLGSLPFCEIGGYVTALQSALNYRKLRKKGVTVRKTIDVLIGTYCIENNLRLLHADHDFDPMEKNLGLKILESEYLR